MALGADRRSIVAWVLRQSAAVIGLGVVAGLIGARLLSGTIANLLFNVRPTDASTYGTATALLGLVALVAVYVAARRAASVDPAAVLK
jgi:ABC-type antimicrobial peptide transport system permease subunit